jgi:MinD superfamily P-loop ATPase
MVVSVASGKGGTGKTTVATSLALSLADVRFLDCDVEEPNAHLLIEPVIEERKYVYLPVPDVDEQLCDLCGRCREVCRYNAIAVLRDTVLVFHELCHGCGSCSYFCPQGAIREKNREMGFVERGQRNELEFVHGNLKVGTPMPTPVIKAVKRYIDEEKVNIIDAPPGTSCPVVESVKGSDYCILVTEPTPFGLHDLTLAVDVLRRLTIPFGIVINRSDIGDERTMNYCRREQVPVLMQIPFKREIASAYSRGVPLVEAVPEYEKRFRALFRRIVKTIQPSSRMSERLPR